MISLEKLRAVKRVISHHSCPDGTASALIIKDALPDVEVLFLKHGTKQHRSLEPLPGTLFVDFTPYVGDTSNALNSEPGSVIDVWIKEGALILDHHPTQRDVVEAFGENGIFGENERGECGAWLAYEHVWLPVCMSRGDRPRSQATAVREFAELAGIRDTWKKDDPRWQQACEQAESLMFWPFEHQSNWWDNNSVLHGRLGEVLFKKKLEAARKSIEEAHVFITKQWHTLVFVSQGVSTTSDATELLEKSEELRSLKLPGNHGQPDLVVGFHYRIDASKLQLQFSMRSHTGYDVGAFAKAHGGGGHKAAAGFTVEQSAEIGANPYAVFRLLLNEWESGQ